MRHEWPRQVEAEYRSCALTQTLALWLTQIGAPPELVRAALEIAEDELSHAELARDVCTAAGAEPRIVLDRARLSFAPERDRLELDVAAVGLRVFCVGETVAVPLFAAMRSRCKVAAARPFFDRVLRDEVRHRDFGWLLLDWMLDTPDGPAVRELAVHEVPGMLARIRRIYGAADPGRRAITPDEEAWGLLPTPEYERIVDRAIAEVHLPRFAARGIVVATDGASPGDGSLR